VLPQSIFLKCHWHAEHAMCCSRQQMKGTRFEELLFRYMVYFLSLSFFASILLPNAVRPRVLAISLAPALWVPVNLVRNAFVLWNGREEKRGEEGPRRLRQKTHQKRKHQKKRLKSGCIYFYSTLGHFGLMLCFSSLCWSLESVEYCICA